jgi:hypothetical protein
MTGLEPSRRVLWGVLWGLVVWLFILAIVLWLLA